MILDLLMELWPAFMFLAIWWWGMWLLGRAFKESGRIIERDRRAYYARKREGEKKLAHTRGRAA